MARESRTSARERRERERSRVAQEQRLARERKERAKAKKDIAERLEEVPESWRQRYRRLLADRGIGASAAHVTSLEQLRTRVQLLPPRPVYVHMRNADHPSLPEPRVLAAMTRDRFERGDNKRDCSNTSALSPSTFLFPERANVARVKPSNLLALALPGGHVECVNVNALRKLHKHGYVLAQSYQRDARGDHWPEMLADTHKSGTVRVPLWLLEEATGQAWPLPALRRAPPHDTTYA